MQAAIMRRWVAVALLMAMVGVLAWSGNAFQAERAFSDRADDNDGYQIHFLYVISSDGTDRSLDKDGTIARWANSINVWLSSKSGGRQFRYDTFNGDLDVTFVRLKSSNADLMRNGVFQRDAMEGELIALGVVSDPQKMYPVYFGGSHSSTHGDAPNPPGLFGQVPIVYESTASNGTRIQITSVEERPQIAEWIMGHELFHAMGATASCGRNEHMSGHTSDNPLDLMYAGSSLWGPWRYIAPDLDIGNDDYWDHNIPNCLDLADSAFIEPVLAGSEPPPLWPIQISEKIDCSEEPTVLSGGNGQSTGITFVNATNEEVQLYWVNFQGQRRSPPDIIAPLGSLPQNSSVGHVFVAADTSGQCLGIYEALEGASRAIIGEIQAISTEDQSDAGGKPDSDGDGVPDDEDQCPNFAGSPAADGC